MEDIWHTLALDRSASRRYAKYFVEVDGKNHCSVNSHSVGSALGSVPIGSAPVGSVPVGLAPVGLVPVGQVPIGVSLVLRPKMRSWTQTSNQQNTKPGKACDTKVQFLILPGKINKLKYNSIANKQ